MNQLETLETVGQSIDEARARFVATRESLQEVLDRGINVPEFRQAIAGPKRVKAKPTWVEGKIADQSMIGGLTQ